ncbi:MAG: dihydroneopterin aldolase [Magnetococcales bacterium]|nr:dihydroneopterin aldolase [Magnetococcales bacterium]
MTSQDHIFIRDIQVRCIIGIQEWERNTLQEVLINLKLFTETSRAGQSDKIEDTVDYKALTKKIMAFTEQSNFFLVEALAEQIAQLCLNDARIHQVHVTVEKPGALRFTQSVGVHIQRTK